MSVVRLEQVEISSSYSDALQSIDVLSSSLVIVSSSNTETSSSLFTTNNLLQTVSGSGHTNTGTLDIVSSSHHLTSQSVSIGSGSQFQFSSSNHLEHNSFTQNITNNSSSLYTVSSSVDTVSSSVAIISGSAYNSATQLITTNNTLSIVSSSHYITSQSVATNSGSVHTFSSSNHNEHGIFTQNIATNSSSIYSTSSSLHATSQSISLISSSVLINSGSLFTLSSSVATLALGTFTRLNVASPSTPNIGHISVGSQTPTIPQIHLQSGATLLSTLTGGALSNVNNTLYFTQGTTGTDAMRLKVAVADTTFSTTQVGGVSNSTSTIATWTIPNTIISAGKTIEMELYGMFTNAAANMTYTLLRNNVSVSVETLSQAATAAPFVFKAKYGVITAGASTTALLFIENVINATQRNRHSSGLLPTHDGSVGNTVFTLQVTFVSATGVFTPFISKIKVI